MKTLFKLYLLGQLIALPFMVGALGSAFSSTETPSTSTRTQAVSNVDLCEALEGLPDHAVVDRYAQIQSVARNLDDVENPGSLEDCLDQ